MYTDDYDYFDYEKFNFSSLKDPGVDTHSSMKSYIFSFRQTRGIITEPVG